MVRLTDDIFNTYLRKSGTVNPYYAEYCDGKSVTCPGLKQWGTVTLPQPVSIDKARTPAVTNAAIRFFIILLSFFCLSCG